MSENKSKDIVKKACAKIGANLDDISVCEVELENLVEKSKELQNLRQRLAEKVGKKPEDIFIAIKEAFKECTEPECEEKNEAQHGVEAETVDEEPKTEVKEKIED